MSQWTLRAATAADADAVTRLVDAAYRPYIDRIGGPPGPMQADYQKVIATAGVVVAEVAGGLGGLIVTTMSGGDFVIENVAVRPELQGRGLGGALLDRAEAEASEGGHGSVRLYTHEQMRENLALYARRGYSVFAHEPLPEGGYLVHLRKMLG